MALWATLQFTLRTPGTIAADWQGWRQCDTQTIARHFASDSFRILYPRIDWGGDGMGYVEAEFQLYTALVAAIMGLARPAEWPGQLVSLLAVGMAFVVLFRLLSRRFGTTAAWVGCAILLTSRGTVYISTSIQPDTLALLAFVIALASFLEFVDDERRANLVISMVATAVAGLVKPTALQLGIVQFCLVALGRRRLLKRRDLWVGWLAVLILVATHMLHAYGLFVTHGNTFGVLGGESKFPHLRQILSPTILFATAKNAVLWGIGIPAAAALAFLAWRRRLDAVELALACGGCAMLIAGLRYTYAEWGTHYHALLIPLGAWALAHAWRVMDIRAPWRGRVLAFVIPLLVAGQHAFFIRQARSLPAEREVVMGEALRNFALPGDLVVVRSTIAAYDPSWPTVQNFEDPRVFYVARARGWSLPVDLAGSHAVEGLRARGARFYVEVGRRRDDPDLDRWLARNAALIADRREGRIWSFGRSIDAVRAGPATKCRDAPHGNARIDNPSRRCSRSRKPIVVALSSVVRPP